MADRPDLRDSAPAGSPLPQDPAYWDGLAQRIRADAAGPLARYAAGGAWYEMLPRQAAWLAAAAALLIVALLLAFPSPPDDDVTTVTASAAYRWMERSIAPEETAGTLMAGPAPPRIDVIMAQFPPADPGRGPTGPEVR